jgi:hypothetical protein
LKHQTSKTKHEQAKTMDTDTEMNVIAPHMLVLEEGAEAAAVAAPIACTSNAEPPTRKQKRKAEDAAVASSATKPKKTSKMEDDDDESDTDAADDAAEARRENKEPEILAEKMRCLAKIAEWTEREVALLDAKASSNKGTQGKRSKKIRRAPALTLDASLETIFDEYERLKEVLGELDSDDEEGVVDDEEAEEEIEEGEDAAKTRMLAELEGWFLAGALKRPRRALDESSAYEAVELAYDKARDKLGLGEHVDDVQREATAFIARDNEVRARKTAANAMATQLEHWYRTSRARKPVRGVSVLSSYDDIASEYEAVCEKLSTEPTLLFHATVVDVVAAVPPPHIVGGRTLRNRDAIKPAEDQYTRLVQEAVAEDDAREEKKALLKELRAWKKDGLYDDAAPDATDLKTLSKPKTMLDEVQAEHDRVRVLLGMVTQADLDAEEDGVEDEDEDDESDMDDEDDGEDEFVAESSSSSESDDESIESSSDDSNDSSSCDEEGDGLVPAGVTVRKPNNVILSDDEDDEDDNADIAAAAAAADVKQN